ncbi:ADP-ribosylation factor-binding protein GGA1-like [Diadema antillarum]|uniref:ADP-ribosylation factor-binding protein GGA1-like n=1 Tax=Diadema antillarum TaxID=105358 RepID=UPI003A89B599
MAEADDWETLETLLNKATNPANREEDWEYIMSFCDKVNHELEGPLTACRILGHKIQSPQERESLQALTVLEACVKNCGEPFHRELGKFRFLNEMIKLISPKYLGNKTSEKVQKKTIELMYSWQKGLPQEQKVKEAYDMLKKQGLIKEDPTYLDKDLFPAAPPKPRMAEFEDEEKSKLLARLLKSKHPEDLQAANRLIKNMVKEDQKRMEKVSRRTNELESCNNNVKLLNEMLAHYREGSTSPEEKELMKELYLTCERMRPSLFRLASDADEKDDCIADILETNDSVVKVMELYKEKFGDVSSTNSASATSANTLDGSKLIDFAGTSPVKQQSIPTLPKPPDPSQPSQAQDSAALLESQLSSLGLDNGQSANRVVQPTSSSDLDKLLGPDPINVPQPQQQQQPQVPPTQTFNSLANSQPIPQLTMPTMFPNVQQQQLIMQQQQMAQMAPSMRPPAMGMMGMTPGFPMMQQQQQRVPMVTGQVTSVFPTQPTTVASSQNATSSSSSNSKPATPAISSDAFADLESLGRGMIKPKAKEENASVTPATNSNSTPAASGDDQLLFLGGSPPAKAPAIAAISTPPVQAAAPAANVTVATPVVATQSQQQQQPMPAAASPASQTVLSLADVFVPLESIQPGSVAPVTAYEKNNVKTVFHFGKDSPRPDIVVIVVSTMSTNTSPLKNLMFQAAVPKTMRVKLQPPSATDLPAYNPILPPSAITQVMLLANPNKDKIRLRFKMQYSLNDQPFTDLGEVDKIPTH